MDKPTPLYAQFDGETVNGVRYAYGDTLKDDVDPGTRDYLVTTGHWSASAPSATNSVAAAVEKGLDDMNRGELVRTAQAEVAAHIDTLDDDKLRSMISSVRAASTVTQDDDDDGEDGTEDGGADDYASLKDRPLASLKAAHLNTIATTEGISLDGAKTNADRVKLIEEARAAKAAAPATPPAA